MAGDQRQRTRPLRSEIQRYLVQESALPNELLDSHGRILDAYNRR